MAEKYVRCNSHCKYPAYDKEEIDNLFYKKTDTDAKLNEISNKFAVVDVTTTIRETASNGSYSGSIMKAMPEGFTATNCVVISKMFGIDTPNSADTLTDSITVSFVSYESEGVTYNNINGSINTTDSTKAGQTYKVRIVLMKIA